MQPDHPRWSETLRDGSRVLIRPVLRQDAAAERDFVESLSPQARRYRFLGRIGHPSDALVLHSADIDYAHSQAFAAVVHDDSRDMFVGISRYRTDSDGTRCECAVTVRDDWQNKGLGTILMTHLIDVARSRGIQHMWCIDSAENLAMADLARYLGFHRKQDADDGAQVIYSRWL